MFTSRRADGSLPRPVRGRSVGLMAGVAGLALLAACSTPGAGSTPTSSAAAAGAANTAAPTGEVTMTWAVNSGDDTYQQYADAFHAQFPNVTIKLQETDFNSLQQNLPRQMAGSDAPDLARLASLGNTVKDGLALNLDSYSKAYGWDQYPPGLLEQMSVGADGVTRGSGSLYQMMGGGWNITGVYYNKTVADGLGMTEAPATFADFEAVLAKAKAAGVTPIEQPGASLNYVYDQLAYTYAADAGMLQPLKDWIYRVPSASFVSPATTKAAETLQSWAKSGYFSTDLNSVQDPEVQSRLGSGEGLFYFTGDWNAATMDKALGADGGFMVLPPVQAGGEYATDAASQAYVIPVKAKNPDVAAFFLNWMNTDPVARTVAVGHNPGGPADAAVPTAPGPVSAQTLESSVQVAKDNAIMDFTANATAGIQTSTFVPQLQLLADGQVSPSDFVNKVQADYESELGR